MSQRLSTSVTFQNLQGRVTALEEGLLAAVTYDHVVAALGYVPANKAGDTFDGAVTISGNVTVPNSTYIKSALANGTVTRLFGLNSSNSLYIGGIDATIASIVIEIASTPVQTISASGVATTGTLSVSGNITMAGAPVATQAYVGTQIANLVNSAPAALDTLNELAASLANDPNFATTMTTALAGKAALTGAAFTGNVTFGDANFGAFFNNGVQPFIAFDSGDNLSFARATNTFSFNIGGVNQVTIGATGNIATGGNVVAGVLAIDSNFGMALVSSNPHLTFDANDYLAYDRTNNTISLVVGGTTKAYINSSGSFSAAGSITASNDPNFNLDIISSNPRATFDANDYLQYDRVANRYNMIIGGAAQFVLDSGGATIVGTECIIGNDSNFRLSLSGSTQPLLRFDSGDQYVYDRTANQHKMVIGGTTKLVVDANGLTATGSLSAGTYVQVGDLNFFAQIASGNPQISFDSGDQIFYDRIANKFYFAIGGVNVASIDASGNMRIKGALTQGVTP